ncbi:MAG: hypothetical protein ACD_73C00155G0003 [uncultured bacterium]|nr:MAG: hypothetical protein ACD_73C00155G0003 [uncultured bacterium]
MAEAKQSIEIQATPKQCLDIISDYECYPEFLKEVSSVTVEKKSGAIAEVTFSLNLIKKFSYTLKMNVKPPTSVTWTFVKGELMKDNKGNWNLEDLGGGLTLATYTIDVSLGLLVPGAISKMLIGSNLPSMLKSFKERIEEKHPKKKK